jgi:hypothetical protein
MGLNRRRAPQDGLTMRLIHVAYPQTRIWERKNVQRPGEYHTTAGSPQAMMTTSAERA